MNYKIDCLQYANWSEKIFTEMRDAKLDAVHATIAYHETLEKLFKSGALVATLKAIR